MPIRFSSIAVSAIALFSASAAHATDLSGKQTPDVFAGSKVYNWTSAYVGGQIGFSNSNHRIDQTFTKSKCTSGRIASDGKCYDRVDVASDGTITPASGAVLETDQTVTTEEIFSSFSDGLNSSGVFGGGTIGADYQVGHNSRFVVGAFFDYNISNADYTTGASFLTDPVFSGSIEDGDSWVLAARAGIALGDDHRTLVYGLVGYGQQDVTYKGSVVGPIGGTFSKDVTVGGLVAGGGLEYALNDVVSIGAEYQHFFGGKETVFDTGLVDCGERFKVTDDASSDKVMAKLKVKLSAGLFGY